MTVPQKILENLPGKLPLIPIPDDTDIPAAVKSALDSFPNLEEHHFTEDAIWRDSFGLTGTFRTFYSGPTIAKVWRLLTSERELSNTSVNEKASFLMRISKESAWIECSFHFSAISPKVDCHGSLSLVPGEDGKWKIWVMKTVLEQLSGQRSVDVLQPKLTIDRESHATNGVKAHLNGTTNGHSDNQRNGDTNGAHETEHFECIILGAGQSGLSVGGRLQALGVKYVILDQLRHVGDSWRQRYHTARLHTIREFSHLPFERTFGPDSEEYLHKDALGAGHQSWAERYGINVWNSTTIESGTWNEQKHLYRLEISGNGTKSTITAPHIVFATGANSSIPVMPDLPGKEKFKGTVMHSVDYKTATELTGKVGIVIGTANTGHDIADDMLESGMDVTMVQRNRTYVLPVEYIEAQYKTMYNETMPIEVSDRNMMTSPVSISRILVNGYFHNAARAEPERFESLEKAGFKVEPFGDLMEVVNVRLGGHYIDIGTSAKIAQGRIKMKSDALPIAFTESGLAFSDGTEIKADVVVFATGFVGNMRLHVERLFGEEVGEKAGDCFGVNEEGEILGAFKPLPQPGLWYIGGTLGFARYYSRFIALSIKATVMGAPLPVYTDEQHKIWL